jgi:spore coat polysaccharide biosynthesis predicted glycosyltransferase SpsG
VNKPIEIICDGGGDFGYGHIRRSSTLAEALSLRGWRVNLKVLSKDAKNDTWCNLATETPAVRLIDLPYEIDQFFLEAKRNGTRCIALDYFGDMNPHLTVSIFEHKNDLPVGERVSGFKYAIIRPEISIRRAKIGMESILVMIGGSDIHNVGPNVALKIASFGPKISLIQGPINFSNYSVANSSITVLKEPKNLEIVMASAEWGVTNGGGSMMEMMSLGKAIYVVPQTVEEDNLAKHLLERGAILGIGIGAIRLPSLEEIDLVGRKAKLCIDGCGVQRIIGHILDEMNNFDVIKT